MGSSLDIDLIYLEALYFAPLFRSPVKQMFGNRKNFRKYYYARIDELHWEQWNNWLISLGYRN